MERWHAKILAAVGTFVIPFCTTMLPLKVSSMFASKGKKGKEVLGCLMCFGGGVFFATYILHMGPEVRLLLKTSLMDPHHIDYPLGDLIMAVGFFIVLYIEKIALSAHRSRMNRKNKRKQKKNDGLPVPGENKIDLEKQEPKVELNNCSNGACVKDVDEPETEKGTLVFQCGCENGKTTGMKATDSDDSLCYHNIHHTSQETPVEKKIEEEDTHSTRSLVLMLALSLHRIFEGMSVGLKYSVTGVWNLFIAVMCHEAVIGFSLGLQFVKNKFTLRRFLVTTVLCSLIMPLGVTIGTIIVEKGEQNRTLDMVNGILQAISTGTFIYVTFFEILHDEIDHHNSSQPKLASLVFGFAIMAALSAIPEPAEILTVANSTENGLLSTLAPDKIY